MPSTWCIALFWLVAAASVWLISRNDDNRRSSLVLLLVVVSTDFNAALDDIGGPRRKEFCRNISKAGSKCGAGRTRQNSKNYSHLFRSQTVARAQK
jgi:hypothetical protein